MEISTSRAAATFLHSKIGACDVEEFWAVALDPGCRLIDAKMLFKGTADSCFIHPRDVFRFALGANAICLLVGHNHPSGLCFPSDADVAMSRRLREAGVLMQIPVVDHIIVGSAGEAGLKFFSFAESLWSHPKKVIRKERFP